MTNKSDEWHMFVWKIENISHSWHQQKECLPSPNVHVQNANWCLQIYPRGKRSSSWIACHLQRLGSGSSNSVQVTFKLALMDIDGSCLKESALFHEKSFKPNETHGSDWFVERKEVFVDQRMQFLPNDTLTICCRISNTSDYSGPSKILARTHVEVKLQTIVLKIRNFSDFELDCLYDEILSTSLEKQILNAGLYLTEACCGDETLTIEIISDKNEQRKFSTCNVFILDAAGIKSKCGKSSIWFDPKITDQEWKFPLIFSKGELIAKKDLYLPNDILSLQIECSSSVGMSMEITETSDVSVFGSIDDECVSVEELRAREDLGNLFRENILSDVNLMTKTKTFPAHKAILSARSPVFKSMFTNDFKEQQNSRVDIDDLDDETINRLLLYIYTNTVEDLQWQTAHQLYVAADKYLIGSLKRKCSSILKDNICPSNACKILVLSDSHRDGHLKNRVYDYILEHEEVLESDDWKDLELRQPRLTSETMSCL